MGRVVFSIDMPEAIAPAIEASKAAQATADEAKAIADEAKATVDTSAASVNEYMDALLGLGTTGETEATDAE